MWGLEHLLATYPDARIVFTHREPVDSVTSYASLTSLVRTMGSDEVDRTEIARDWTSRLCRVAMHALEVREARVYPEAIFYDLQFGDFIADPFGAVEKIYQAFALPMSQDGEARMRAFVTDNPKGKHGTHNYSPEEFGVNPAEVRRDFQTYIDRFGLQPE